MLIIIHLLKYSILAAWGHCLYPFLCSYKHLYITLKFAFFHLNYIFGHISGQYIQLLFILYNSLWDILQLDIPVLISPFHWCSGCFQLVAVITNVMTTHIWTSCALGPAFPNLEPPQRDCRGEECVHFDDQRYWPILKMY